MAEFKPIQLYHFHFDFGLRGEAILEISIDPMRVLIESFWCFCIVIHVRTTCAIISGDEVNVAQTCVGTLGGGI